METGSARSLVALMLWHLAGLVATVGIVGQVLIGRSITSMPSRHQVFLLALAAAFVFAAGLNIWRLQRRAAPYSVLSTALLAIAAFGLAALALDLVQAPYVSRAALATCIALTILVLTLARWMRPIWLVAGAVVLVGLSAVVQGFMGRILEVRPTPLRSVSVVNTGYLSMTVTYYDNYFANCDAQTEVCNYLPRDGGGINAMREGYLLTTGEGLTYYATRDARGELTVSTLPYTVPINDADFAASGEPADHHRLFRVTDVLVEEHGDQATLYASHHYYYKSADCVVLRLSVMRGSSAGIANGTLPQRWDTLYETKPCLPRHPSPRHPMFFGMESGGSLARLDASTLLMTVGDHSFNGWNSYTNAAQDLQSDYGKTLAIDLDRGVSSVFTFGHRNPQGLYVTKTGEIWSTEHGPAGGDELNRLVRGTNYGWPLVSYGTEYGERFWPLSKTPNDHRGFEEPVYSWVPSIAVSNLIVLEKDRFPYWKGDMLIASYRASLFRARIRAGRVVTLEPVGLRRPSQRGRIRDLFEDRDGTILLWFDAGTLAFLEPEESAAGTPQTESDRGQTLFAACIACHAVADGATHGIGPDLAGIVNRPIASADGFRYSQALAKSPGRWTEQNLDRFLADPQAFAPGNTMQFSGLPNPADRAQLIAYMKGADPRGER